MATISLFHQRTEYVKRPGPVQLCENVFNNAATMNHAETGRKATNAKHLRKAPNLPSR
jgi:hypothetical protein